MNELSAFIRQQLDAEAAKLDKDERVAHACPDKSWPQIGQGAGAEHIARWDPKRVLESVEQGRRDIEAKKLILDWCDRMDPGDGLGGLMAPDAREIRRLLAVKYADHPGFRAEWGAAEGAGAEPRSLRVD